jgi:hypothetical protein
MRQLHLWPNWPYRGHMTARMPILVLMALAACQHPGEAHAAEPTHVAAPTTPVGLPDQNAKDAATKAIAALPPCNLKPTSGLTTGTLTIVTRECTNNRCIRTCCNTCEFAAVLSGGASPKGLDAAQFRHLFPSFSDKPLECEINEWNTQLKGVTLGLSAPEKGPESNRAPVLACVQAAAR